MKNRTHGKFTLIELLVVMAIISILASMLLPALQNANEAVKEVKCANIKRQLGLAFQLYISDSDGVIPGALVGPFPVGKVLAKLDYIPFSPDSFFGGICPSSSLDKPTAWSGDYCNITIGASYNFLKQWGTPISFKITNLNKLSKRSYWMDTRGWGLWGGSDGAFAYASSSEIYFWHANGKHNVVGFLDGHVESMSDDEIFNISNVFWEPWTN